MDREKAKQILESWLLRSKGTEEQLGYIEGWFSKEDEEAFNMAIEALKQERPEGEWKLVDHLWECNRCHYRLTLQNKSEPTNFCPNCGSRNRKE